jgi:hypothetical protein
MIRDCQDNGTRGIDAHDIHRIWIINGHERSG